MKCPTCMQVGEKSRVAHGGSASTAMNVEEYWDEEGVAHRHDPNVITENYYCTRGHGFKVREYATPCRACGWDRAKPDGVTSAPA